MLLAPDSGTGVGNATRRTEASVGRFACVSHELPLHWNVGDPGIFDRPKLNILVRVYRYADACVHGRPHPHVRLVILRLSLLCFHTLPISIQRCAGCADSSRNEQAHRKSAGRASKPYDPTRGSDISPRWYCTSEKQLTVPEWARPRHQSSGREPCPVKTPPGPCRPKS